MVQPEKKMTVNEASDIPFIHRECPICGCDDYTVVHRARAGKFFRSRFGIETATIAECRDCRLKFTNPVVNDELNDLQYLDSKTGYNTKTFERVEQLAWDDQRICFHEVRQYAADRPDYNVLDFGCGRGGLIWQCEQAGIQARGIDLNPGGVALAQSFGVKNVENRDLREMPDASYDAIAALHVFEHLPNCRDIVGHFRRIIKRPGYVFVMVPNVGSLRFRRKPDAYWNIPYQHMNAFTRLLLDKLFQGAGFQSVKLRANYMSDSLKVNQKVKVSMMMTKVMGNLMGAFPTKLFRVYKLSE